MNWVKKRNLPAVETIKHSNHPCLEINDLWNALHSTFNLAQNYQVDVDILDEILDKSTIEWLPFSEEEFRKAIAKCNNLSAPGPNKLSWSHLKYIINNEACFGNIISIANVCFELDLWLSHFKSSMSIIIPMLWDAWTPTIFFFFILIFFSLFFYFSFEQWRGAWHLSHMTDHMMWCHRPRIW